ncbi:MAG: heparinase, partial [Parabacteroides sp.]|nr:heparinase [Parabacteroides sp.]
MNKLSLLGVWLIAISLFFQLSAQTFDYNRVAPHPRLLMKKGEEQRIKDNIQGKPEMLEVYNQIISAAD